MFKKRRAVAPGFRLPPPYNPLAGQHKGLAQPTDPSRITTMRVKEIHDDYLVCEGWDPDNHVYHLDHKVAKPMALRRNPVKTIELPDESEVEVGEAVYDQVWPPYFVGELIVAAKMMGVVGGAVAKPVVSEAEGEGEGGRLLTPADQTLPEGMPYEGMAVDSGGETVAIGEGYPVFWIDLNVAGRTFREAIKLFELKTALTPGSTADAYPLDDEGDPITDDADVVFEVVDTRGIYRGRAKDAYSSPHDQGSRGEARLRNGVWEITYLQPHALLIRGQLTADLEATDATCTIDGVEVMQPSGAIIVTTDPAANVTSTNRHKHEGSENGEVTAAWDEANDVFYNVQTDCP
jgi:hypothetical protein